MPIDSSRLKRTQNSHVGLKLKLRFLFRGVSFVILTSIFIVFGSVIYYPDVDIFHVFYEHRRLGTDECVEPADPKILALAYAIGVLYMFIALAIIADEYFVPSLDVIAGRLNLSPNVAGATLMAAGGSSPELFTSAVGTFMRSDVGFGTIVGSAVFNVLLVIGACAVISGNANHMITLEAWPLARDSIYYTIVIVVLCVFFAVTSPQQIDWWEALILHLLYWIYVILMMYNDRIYGYLYPPTTLLEKNRRRPSVVQMSSAFRQGIHTMMRSRHSIMDTAGTRLVATLGPGVDAAFRKYDTNGDGTIDSLELKSLLIDLDMPADDDTLNVAMIALDSNNDKKISFDEFSTWYMANEDRLRSKISEAFRAVDANNNGQIDIDEVKALLESLGAVILGDNEVSATIGEMKTGGVASTGNGGDSTAQTVSYAEFEAWYLRSPYWEQNRKAAEAAQDVAEGISLYQPEPVESGWYAVAWYYVTFPLILMFHFTVVDTRRPGMYKYCYASFFACLIWMGIFSYCMVSWIEVVGSTLGIPNVIMGLTFLAAGTSVPDMLSAVIVAKQGKGDMAVASSIGSNVFDITVGLALPWILYWMYYQEAVYVQSDSLLISIISLLATLIFLIAVAYLRAWTLPVSSGYALIFLYFCFVAEQLAMARWGDC